MEHLNYDPRIFIQDTLEHAQAIILTPEQGLTTQQRWERETEWLATRIKFPSPMPLLIDYGCGVGRIAKLFENPVLGIDISPTMRQQAIEYVYRAGFATTHSPMLRMMVEAGLRAQGATAIWCLQHVRDPDYDTQLLHDALVPGSYLWTLDQTTRRYVPATYEDGNFTWIDDGASVQDTLVECGFILLHEEPMPKELCEGDARLRQWLRP